MRLAVLVLALLMLVSGLASETQHAQRRPLKSRKTALKAPTTYEKRLLRYDPITSQPVYYDPKPQIVPLDAKSGRYALTWIGYDGTQKKVVFQRADVIDAVVSATVSKAQGGYLYVYTVSNLPSSGEHLAGFTVQNFAGDVAPVPVEHIFVGRMSGSIDEFKAGNWFRFAPLPDYRPVVTPGRDITFSLLSASPPGLVECRVHGGQIGIKGAGEEMPYELESALPRYESWPSGYTIGPISHLKSLSVNSRAIYVADRLDESRKLGWITAAALQWYVEKLKSNRLNEVMAQAEQDLRRGRITKEVYAMIRGINS